jgi:hypothetical protein
MKGPESNVTKGAKKILRKTGSITWKVVKGVVKVMVGFSGKIITTIFNNRKPISRFAGKTTEVIVEVSLAGVETVYRNRKEIVGVGKATAGIVTGTTKAAYDAGRNLYALATVKDQKLLDLEQKFKGKVRNITV